MALVNLTHPKPFKELSHSSAAQFDSCARKYQIRKTFQWPANSEREDSLAAMSGRAIHVYLQSLYAGGDEDAAHYNFFTEWDFFIEASARPEDRRTRNMEAALLTAHYLAAQLQPDPRRVARVDLSHLGISAPQPAIEVKFNIILSHADWTHDYHYRGLIDLIEFDPDHGLFTTADIKTHRAPRDNTEHRYKRSTQTVPYGLVVEALTGDSLMDSPTSYNVRYIDAFVDLVSPRLSLFNFIKTQTHINDWLRATALRCERMERLANWPVWPRSETGCDAYGRPCQFYSLLCDIPDRQMLQETILGFNPPPPPSSWNEWFTINIDLTELWNPANDPH